MMPHATRTRREPMGNPVTDEQWDLTAALDDAIEHCHWEIDADDYRGASTCGRASIVNVDGRKSFMRRLKSNVEDDRTHYGRRHARPKVEIGGFCIVAIADEYNGGYRVSIIEQNIVDGANYQRLDFQERLHDEFLQRMNVNGYLSDARVSSRMD